MVMNLGDDLFNSNTNPSCSHINVGYGTDLTINSLVKKIKKIVGYNGKVEFDKSKLNGTKRKLLDSKKIINLGWKPKYSLDQGLKKTYKDFLSNIRN